MDPVAAAVVGMVVSIDGGGRAKPLGDVLEPVEGGVPVWVMDDSNRKRVATVWMDDLDGLYLSSLGLQQRNWLGSLQRQR